MERRLVLIKLVITDLDNTIYNWVDFYVPSFNAMVKELSRLTGIKEEALRASFKKVHRKHRTSEYAFAIQELDVIAETNAGLSVREIIEKYSSAITAFRVMRGKMLRLYDSVQETLRKIRSAGRKIVGHTDAMMFYAVRRIKQLDVERYLDGLVAPRDHGLPLGTRPEDFRSSSNPSRYKSAVPINRELDPTISKPSPEVLNEILRLFGAEPAEAIYVGDSLKKDVYMAQRCGVFEVYAEYGKIYNPEHYRQLVEITHWTDEDVAQEVELGRLNISPSFTISAFSDLLEVIERIELRS